MKKYIISAVVVVLVVVVAVFVFMRGASTQKQVAELLSAKYGKPVSELQIVVSTDTGKFAKGTYNEVTGGGGVWFAAKTANGWVLAYDGNGIVTCAAVNGFNFPNDIVPQCIDTQNNNKLIQR